MSVVTALVVVKNAGLVGLFFVGCIACAWTQYVFIDIFKVKAQWKQAIVARTKSDFIELLTFVLGFINPSRIAITFNADELPEGNSFKVDANNVLSSILTPNSVIIANHQIYTDWFYLWFLSYTAKLAHGVFIILKDLSNIPVLGYGMNNYNFLFLSRKWEKDKVAMTDKLLEIDADARGSGPAAGVVPVSSTNISAEFGGIRVWPEQSVSKDIAPYQMILYPEGTVPSARTTAKSKQFCIDKGLPPLKHVLLPRIRGLFLVLQQLRGTIEVIYDVTCGYSDLTADEYGEDKFTLKRTFLLGQGARQVNYHVRTFKISDIPLGEKIIDIDNVSETDLKKFEDWVFKIWYEKDARMASFYKNGSFVEPGDSTLTTVTADVKLSHWTKVPPIFAVFLITLLLLRVVWVALRSVVGF